jgi:predicted regulator of Ras-like GTPase activity (Roadblock/LC7/MglB family)
VRWKAFYGHLQCHDMNTKNASLDMIKKTARTHLRNLQAVSPEVRSCALISFDGLLIASFFAEGVNGDRFSAMCASLLALSTQAAKEVGRGQLRQIILDGEHGPVLLIRAGMVGVLMVAANSSTNLGKLILDTRSTATDLGAMHLQAVE